MAEQPESIFPLSPRISPRFEARIEDFDPQQIEAIVRLHCTQRSALARWQNAFTDRFGAPWVDVIGREVDLWAMSLELTGMLSEEQERRLREAAGGQDSEMMDASAPAGRP